MSLPPADIAYLAERGLVYKLASEANMTCVVFPGYVLPTGYDHAQSDLLLRLSTGYPDVPPDMWWFDPGLRRGDGLVVPSTEHTEQYLGRSWQRWSRHFNAGQWQSGVDGMENFLALVRRELERCALEPRR